MARKVRRLKPETISSLFSVSQVSIGDEEVTIRPLALIQWIELISKVNAMTDKFSEAGINWTNYQSNESLVKLVSIILSNFPEVLENATGIAQEDLVELPIEVLVDLLSAVIEINIKSKDVLLKNSQRLTEMFKGLEKTSLAE